MAVRRRPPNIVRTRGAEVAWLALLGILVALFLLVAADALMLESLLPAFVAAGFVLVVLAWRQTRAERLPVSLRRRPRFAELASADVEELVAQEADEADGEFHAARERLLRHIEERKRALTGSDV